VEADLSDYRCGTCATSFAMSGVEGAVRCPKCGAEAAEVLPDDLEEVAPGAVPPPQPRPAATRARSAPQPSRRTASGAASRTQATRTRAPGDGATEPPPNRTIPIVIGAVIAAAAVAAWFGLRDGGGSGEDRATNTATSGPIDATENAAPGKPVAASGAPSDQAAARHAALAPADLAGRKELIAYCREHDLDAVRLALLREVLMLDPQDAEARIALGFKRHDAPNSPFHGRWLDATDQKLAAEFDARLATG
jgi:hypothetical protein